MKRYALLATFLFLASCQDAVQSPTEAGLSPEGVITGTDLVETPSGAVFSQQEWAAKTDEERASYQVPAAERVAQSRISTTNITAPSLSVTGNAGPKVLCHTNASSCGQIPGIFPGSTVTYWNDAQWAAGTVATFSQFDAIYIHDNAGAASGIIASKNVWGSATTGRVALTGVHFEHCSSAQLTSGPCRVFKASMDWIHAGIGTGLLMSTQVSANGNNVIPTVAPYAGVTFSANGGGWDLVRITDPGHATMQGSTDASLSNFGQSSHSLFGTVGGMTSVAEICSTDRSTYPGACAGGTWRHHYLVASVGVADQDGDGIGDLVDNCPTVGNANQLDTNGNGVGDACESAPAVTISPKLSQVAPGASVTFTAVAEDSDHPLSALTYVWRVDGVVVPGAVSSTFTQSFSADAVVRVTVRDPGNLSGFDEAEVKVQTDSSPPVITANIVGTLGQNGWYTSDVSLTFTIVDAESPVLGQQNCGPQAITQDTDGLTFTCTAASAGGTISRTVDIKRDATAPIVMPNVTGTPGLHGWYTGDVSVKWTYSDYTAGLQAVTPSCAPLTLSTDTDGTVFSCTATDQAGHQTTQQVTVMRDASGPVITPTVNGRLGAAGWYTSNVDVDWDVKDAVSGVSIGSTCVTTTLSNDTGGFTFACTATNGAGTEATAQVVVKRDATQPTLLSNVIGTAGNNGWYTSNVNIGWTYEDETSGVTAAPSCAPTTLSSDDASITYVCTVTNGAGLTANGTRTVKRDATAPVISYGGNAGTYTVDQTIAITCSATDAMSGIATTTCANINGAAATFSLGPNTATATATDNAGNVKTVPTTFTVGATTASICALVTRFVSNGGIANSMCKQLQNGSINAFINHVQAQSGKSLTPANAALLIRLAQSL